MTVKILRTDLSEISKIKLVCKCGFSAEYPIEINHGIPESCPVCSKKAPAVSFAELLKSFLNMKNTLKNFSDFQIQIETEEK